MPAGQKQELPKRVDQFKVSKYNKFLSKAKSLPKECPELSTSIKEYTITFANDTIKIRGDCDWDSLDFFSLRQLLFKDKFEQFELKKSNLINPAAASFHACGNCFPSICD